MNSPQSKFALVLAVAILTVTALSVFVRRPLNPVPALVSAPREVPARELVLRNERSFWKDETDPFTGIVFENYPGGSAKSRSMLSHGVLDGVSEGWHTNGTLQVREYFQNGVSHGARTKWFESGGKMSEANIELGKIVGVFRRWHENGALAEEIQMSDNVPDGISRAFYPSGALKAEAKLEKGKVLEQHFWKENEAPVVAASGTAP